MTDRLDGPFPELRTARLHLRRITIDDLDWYLAHFSRPEIVSATGFPAPADRAAALAELHEYVIDLYEARRGIRWGICLEGSDELIGSIGFYRWTDGPPAHAELGYDLVPEHWGRGIMAEALGAVLDFGAAAMGLERVEASVMLHNDRSMRLLERAGFERVRIMRGEGTDEDGRPVDEWLYAREERRPDGRRS